MEIENIVDRSERSLLLWTKWIEESVQFYAFNSYPISENEDE